MRAKVVFGTGAMTVGPEGMKGAGRKVKTVLMQNVTSIRSSLFGEIVEDFAYPIPPRREISLWPTMRYVVSRGQWVDTRSGTVVRSAQAVYIVDGTRRTIHYWEA
jgi:hypothetical protein